MEVSGHVMSNPDVFPDVFVSIMIGLDLDRDSLTACRLVCRKWNAFIGGHLWNNARIKTYVEQLWHKSTPGFYERRSYAEVRCMAEDGDLILCGMYNGNIEAWRGKRPPKKVFRLEKKHTGSVFCLAIGRKIFISGSFDRTVGVWNREKMEIITRFSDHTDMVYGVTVTDRFFASCSHDATVRVWSYELKDDDSFSFTTRRLFRNHGSGVKCIDSDEQARCVTGSRDGTLRLWSLDSGEELSSPVAFLGATPSCLQMRWPVVVVGLKSKMFQDCEKGYVVQVYDMSAGKCLRVLYGHLARITCLRFDARHIVSGDEDGNVLLWETEGKSESPLGIFNEAMGSGLQSGKVVGLTMEFAGLLIALQRKVMYYDFLKN